ncbi:DnaJ -like protein subfamily C member 9 [Toxocara canis]|uniref:DnaJ-like protein subfamily C member 9 n=1 Tax=Toxocara canis TaxID=6265 RepID=A0A0B2W2G5_TOXCA|nr:DnaJ -like protein subfamily C member 9 [Toxocara canis]
MALENRAVRKGNSRSKLNMAGAKTTQSSREMTSTFADDAKRLFGTTNLYDLLQLQGTRKSRQNLSQDAIKKAFFKQSLQYHPDRCVEECAKKEATEKFQIISRAYAVLGDEQKRKLYDETGLLDDAEVSGDDADWMERWRVLFPEITVEDIDAFIKKYRESGEEHTAIKESFIKNKGDMNKIMDEVIGLTYEDEDRVRKIIDKMIEKGELKATRYYAAEPAKRKEKRRKAAEKEAKVTSQSGEEHTAIKESFIKNKGDMNKIMDEVIGLTYEDEDRVRKIIDKMIEKGELKATRYYAAEPAKRKEKRRKAAEKEAKEAEQVLRELKAKEGTTELKALIRKRQLDRDSFLDDLAAKYAKPSAKGKKKKKTAG